MIFLLIIKPEYDLFDVWNLMNSLSIEPLYSSTNDEGLEELYIRVDKDCLQYLMDELEEYILDIKKKDLPLFDWNDQWEKHAPGYVDGFVHLNLNDFGAKESFSIKLKPGPGFGDLSHPTTSMVLKLLCEEKDGHSSFLDIGTGSGILAIGAALLGFKHVYAVDIDQGALDHAKQNAQLNQLDSLIHFSFPKEFDISLKSNYPRIAAMNMIFSEQIQAWSSLKRFHSSIQTLLVSGVLVKERTAYLEKAAFWGFQVVKELVENEWSAFKLIKIDCEKDRAILKE